jgi:organic hydroperoxide reductase OsmC/OhrA
VHPYPHTYLAAAAGRDCGPVTVTSAQLPSLDTAPPPEFDGPRGAWSPETLLCASLADCFILTFRAVARAARVSFGLGRFTVGVTTEEVALPVPVTSIYAELRGLGHLSVLSARRWMDCTPAALNATV